MILHFGPPEKKAKQVYENDMQIQKPYIYSEKAMYAVLSYAYLELEQ